MDDNRIRQYLDRRLQENDVKGAIEFAIEEQNRFPKLKRLLRFLRNIAAQLSTEDEELDWYAVLGVDSSADIKTMKQHYVKLVKDNKLGSQEVHKLLNKAWDTLSNKFTRRDYDLRRRSRQMQQNAFVVKHASSATQLLQPAPVLHDALGNNTSGLKLVSSATQAIQPAPGLYNICGNNGGDLTSISAGTNSTQRTPDMYNALGNKERGPRFFPTATPLIQPASGMHNESGNNGRGLSMIPSDTQLIQPRRGRYNVSGTRGSDLKLVSSATQSIRLAPGVHNLLGNRGTGPMVVSSATRSVQPAPGIYSVSGNIGIGPRLVFSAEESFEQGPGMDNVLGNGGSGPKSVSSAKLSIQPAPSMYNVSKDYGSIPRPVSPSSKSFYLAPGLCSGSGNNGSGLAKDSSNAQLFQSAHVNLKRRYEGEGLTSTTREMAPCTHRKESGISLPSVAGSIGGTHLKLKERSRSVEDSCDSCKNVPKNSRAEKAGASGSRRGNSLNKLSDDVKNILMDKARNAILGKLSERNAAARDNNEHNPADNIDDAATEGLKEEMKTMEVPDSDFHDFDSDRTEESFAENQVWAVYDDDDGMPRLYALIRKASKRSPKLQLSWLNSESNMEPESLTWIDSGFHKTCGDFCVEKEKISIKLNSFSHRVAGCTKAANVFQIFQKKGDVWALYRNWSPKWNKHTTEEEKHKYEMVEVLADYNEDKGVTIVPLVKVAGFKAVFCQHSDAKEVRTVPKEEIFRFSHQVSSYLLMDQEAPNVPKGSKELDPAAMPLDLLQVIH